MIMNLYVYYMLCNLVQLIFLFFFFNRIFALVSLGLCIDGFIWFFMIEEFFLLVVLNLCIRIIGMREREREREY